MTDEGEQIMRELKESGQDNPSKFKRASDLTDDETAIRKTADRIKSLKGLILNSCISECPKCGWKQHPKSTVSIQCRKCNHSYRVYPEGSPCRIVKCPSKFRPLLIELSDLQNTGRRTSDGIL